MRIDEALYLTTIVDRADGTTVYVHASSLGRDAFDRYWRPLSSVYDRIMLERRFYSAPKVATKMLELVAREQGLWDGPMGVEHGLMNELRRLANVAAPGSGSNGHAPGWQLIPFVDAVRDGIIDAEDAEAIEGLLVFFTCVWHTAERTSRREFVTTGVALSGAQTSSLSLSEYLASLPTSIATGNTGATAPAPSSPPSSTGQPATASKPASGNAQINFPGEAPRSFVIAN